MRLHDVHSKLTPSISLQLVASIRLTSRDCSQVWCLQQYGHPHGYAGCVVLAVLADEVPPAVENLLQLSSLERYRHRHR